MGFFVNKRAKVCGSWLFVEMNNKNWFFSRDGRFGAMAKFLAKSYLLRYV